MKRLRPRLTYANVVSTLCLFLLLGGGAALASSGVLPKDSVGTPQLKKEAVTGAKVKNGSLKGADLDLDSLGQVPSASHAQTAGSAERASTALQADTAAPRGAAGGALAGIYPNPVIAPRAIGSDQLAEGAVIGSKIDAGAVSRADLARYAVGAESLGPIRVEEAVFEEVGYFHDATHTDGIHVACPGNSVLLTGGFSTNAHHGTEIASSYPSYNEWVVGGYNAGAIQVDAFAVCLF